MCVIIYNDSHKYAHMNVNFNYSNIYIYYILNNIIIPPNIQDPHQNPCGVLTQFSCAYFTNSHASHNTNTHWVNMCICVGPITHVLYTFPISNLVHMRDLVTN